MNRCIVAALCWALAGSVCAQAPTRIRADVVAFDGKLLTVKTAVGKEIKLRVTDAGQVDQLLDPAAYEQLVAES